MSSLKHTCTIIKVLINMDFNKYVNIILNIKLTAADEEGRGVRKKD